MWHCRLRRCLALAARGSPGPYHLYCALRPRTVSAAPGTRGRMGSAKRVSRCYSRGLAPPPVARDQPIREARERDRDRDEERRGDEVVRAVEVRGLVDRGLVENLDDAEHAHERGVLLEPDEVVEERRDDPPHGLRDHDDAGRL